MAFVSPLLGTQDGIGSNFFLPNYGMTQPPANASLMPANVTAPAANAYISDTAAAPTNSFYPAAPTLSPGLGNVLGGNTLPGTTPPSNSLGMNTGTMGLLLGGIQTIGSLWQAWEANKLAQKEFKFNKEFATTNLENQTDSYNTTLENHSNARGAYEGWDNQKTRKYIGDHKLDKPKL